MKAITVAPGKAGSARLEDLPDPHAGAGELLVQGIAMGVCGTDVEIVGGGYGWPPDGRDRLVLGHESLGRVLEAPAKSSFSEGDLVVGIVRRPDPVPCVCCGQGEWDMCRNGRYTERGIKERDGYGSERYALEADFAVPVEPALGELGVLVEPTSVVAKAWEQIERIGRRACFEANRVLVTGAGPVGLLAALLAVQRGLETHVLDRVTEGPKPALVRDLGATYHTGSVAEACPAPDLIVECTGVAQLVFDVMLQSAPGSIVCLAGVSSGSHRLTVDAAAVNNGLVLENDVVFGSVNANRRHYSAAVEALAKADRDWLERLIARRVPLERWQEALERRPGDVKTVIELGAPAA